MLYPSGRGSRQGFRERFDGGPRPAAAVAIIPRARRPRKTRSHHDLARYEARTRVRVCVVRLG